MENDKQLIGGAEKHCNHYYQYSLALPLCVIAHASVPKHPHMIQSSGAHRVLARSGYHCDVLISQIISPSSIHLPVAANFGSLISHN